ncbi:DUF4147 domain-containing protein, partial [Candidatus Bathyarchaeota archaeon]|nr:DUF4147 domain-containing protein [Candidatus Bathyarchaeota archaeon]
MIKIKNKEQLVENGGTQLDRKARALVLKSLESALNAVDPKRLVRSKLLLKNSTLEVNGHSFDLEKFKNVYVVGGGKASGSMAETLEQILGKHITSGFVNVPRGNKHKTESIRLHKASHPIPDKSGAKGTLHMLEIAEQAREEDLIICLISGGGSSLMPLPRGGITINEKRKIT